MERSLSRSPTPSRRPLLSEGRAGGNSTFLESSPVKSVRVVPHKVNQPIEVVGCQPGTKGPALQRASTASDERAAPALHNPRRWQNKFFNGQDIVEEGAGAPITTDSLSAASNSQDGVDLAGVGVGAGEVDMSTKRKVPVLSNVRPTPVCSAGNTLNDLIERNINHVGQDGHQQPKQGDAWHMDERSAGQFSPHPSLRVHFTDDMHPQELGVEQLDLETQEYECSPSAREFLTCEEGIHKPSRLWLEEQAARRAAREEQQQRELCGTRVDRCVDNVVRVLLQDTAQNHYHEENVTQGRVRVHDFDRAKHTLLLKQLAAERRAGLVPPRKKETVRVRGEYSEDLPLNGSLEGQSVLDAFQTLNQQSLQLHQQENKQQEFFQAEELFTDHPSAVEQVYQQMGEDEGDSGSVHSICTSNSSAAAYLQNFQAQQASSRLATPMNDDLPIHQPTQPPPQQQQQQLLPSEATLQHDQKPLQQVSRAKNQKDKFRNLQTENKLSLSESAPALSMRLEPSVIGLAPDAISKQKKLQQALRASPLAGTSALTRFSVEHMNLQNFNFAFAPSPDDLLARYDQETASTPSALAKSQPQHFEESHSAPLFPPISGSTGHGDTASRSLHASKAAHLAERIMQSKEDTQRESPLGNGKPYDEAGLYVSYSAGGSASRAGSFKQTLGSANKGPPPAGGGPRGKGVGVGVGVGGKGAVMHQLGGGGPVLAGLRKLSGNALLSPHATPPQEPQHDSEGVVMAAYAAAMGVHWDPSRGGVGGQQVSAQDRVALQDLLAAVELSRARAPLFSQEDAPSSLDLLNRSESYLELSAPARSPLDPRSSAGVRVRMPDEEVEGADGAPRSLSVNVRATTPQERRDRASELEDDDDDDDEMALEEELRAMLQEQRPRGGGKYGLRAVESSEPALRKHPRVSKGQRFGKAVGANSRSEEGLPVLVVGAANIPPRKSTRPAQRRQLSSTASAASVMTHSSSSLALSLDSSRESIQSNCSGRFSRSSGVGAGGENNAFTPTAAALLVKYGITNNLKQPTSFLASGGQSQATKAGTGKPRRVAAPKKMLSTLESLDGRGLDASSLLERTMAGCEEEEE